MAAVAPWRLRLRENFTSWPSLREFLRLPHDHPVPKSPFPLNLPRRLAEKIEKGNPKDPLLMQFLPSPEEFQKTEGFVSQPVADEAFQLSPRLLQKYSSRVLFVTTAACAMNCRFCFRKNYPYEGKSENSFEEEFKLVEGNVNIEEVILSGGDPLSLSNQNLGEIVDRLNTIPHVRRLRIHTRFPIGIPERIDEGFIELLKRFKGVAYFAIHTNHPSEWDDEVDEAHRKLRNAGVVLLSQTVLLRGINDTVDVLEVLFKRLVNLGIVTYYLHQLDRIDGGAHFEVNRELGKKLIAELRGRLPGYGVPTFVEEIPFQPSKTPI